MAKFLVSTSLPVHAAVAEITHAMEAAGMTLFATIDHGENATNVGLDLPDTVVLTTGNPKVGTDLISSYPDLALELPPRLLVRATPQGTEVWLASVVESLARLAGAPSDPTAEKIDGRLSSIVTAALHPDS
ncbi:MAG: DUF302 domain-containing protein [Ferrimicrobium sp.]